MSVCTTDNPRNKAFLASDEAIISGFHAGDRNLTTAQRHSVTYLPPRHPQAFEFRFDRELIRNVSTFPAREKDLRRWPFYLSLRENASLRRFPAIADGVHSSKIVY
jgi:hypothetical protein